MILIVGLGNPGKKFEKTRHNLGARAVDEIAANFQFPNFNFQINSNSQISEKTISGQKVILAKPKTFMNNSGSSIKLLIKNLKLKNGDLIVIHDDLALALGKVRIVKNRGSAGHKGVESIIRELKTKDFVRFRLGIRPEPYTLNPKPLDRFVLQKFTKEEEKIVKKVIKKTARAIEFTLKQGLQKAMNQHNK